MVCPYPVIKEIGQCCGLDPCGVEWIRPCDAVGGCWDRSKCSGCEEPVFPAAAEQFYGDSNTEDGSRGHQSQDLVGSVGVSATVLDPVAEVGSSSPPVPATTCPHDIRYPWQCDACDERFLAEATPMGEPLKTCPFCGGRPKIEQRTTIESKKLWTKLVCDNPGCSAICGTDYHDDPAKAVNEWNRRVLDPRIAKLEGLLKEAMLRIEQLRFCAWSKQNLSASDELIDRIKQELTE